MVISGSLSSFSFFIDTRVLFRPTGRTDCVPISIEERFYFMVQILNEYVFPRKLDKKGCFCMDSQDYHNQ